MAGSTFLRAFFVLLAGIALSGCEVIGDIFQAGMAVGIILVVAVIAFAIFVIGKVRRNV